jgi:hypothetical protein
MKAEPNEVILYELMTKVELVKGVCSRLQKYRMKFSGKNYLPQMLTGVDHEMGFNVPPHTRVKAEDILKVHKIFMGDHNNYVFRSIYFLEGQKEEAIKLIRASIEEQVTRAKEESAKLYEIWVNREKK